jgi:tripartite-type tricarboxylate transporter receptor subunit TctC
VIIEELGKVFKEALKDKELIEKFGNTGFIVENLGMEEAAEFLAKDYQRKLEVAKAINMVPK